MSELQDRYHRQRFRRRPIAPHPGRAMWAYPGVTVLIAVVSARGTPPIEPLEVPKYSFALSSPAVQRGEVTAGGVLTLELARVRTVVPGSAFGLSREEDELDALSGPNDHIALPQSFALLFSVDELSRGLAPPDPLLIERDVPYNAFDQAIRGHAAGDEYQSTLLVTLPTLAITPPTDTDWNNVLLRNNFDEGGTDFAAAPETSAADIVFNENQDRVDAMAVVDLATSAIYFSASRNSPSLPGLPGQTEPSGANICVNALAVYQNAEQACSDTYNQQRASCRAALLSQPNDSPSTLYASYADLHLLQDDDIDAMVVFDVNADGLFNGVDFVLFSLTADSPSLALIPGASEIAAAADVFAVSADQPGIRLVASAAELGLGDASDNIDALDVLVCTDPVGCADLHAIRTGTPIPAVSDWGMFVMLLLLVIGGTVLIQHKGNVHVTI